MAVSFACAPMTLFGEGILPEIVPYIKRAGVKKALILSDRGLEKAGLLEGLYQTFTQAEICYCTYLDVQPNPTLENVKESLEQYRKEHCDFLISMGGGSVADCAKAVRLLLGNGGELRAYRGANKSKAKGPFYIAVNTTAGTASEISRAFLISDTERQEKMIFKDDYVMADIAVEDVSLTTGLPAAITAQTGMDALTHAVEGYLSSRHSFLTDMAAENAIELILRWLPEAVEQGRNQAAREGMIYAQYLAGMSFGNAGLGLVHAMAHQLGAVYGLPHGLCNAMLLPYVLEFYRPFSKERMAQLGRVLAGEKEAGECTAEEYARMAVHMILHLSHRLGTDSSLKSLGVREEDLPLLTEKALADGCIATSPVMADRQQVLEIYQNAWEGGGIDGAGR